jgi:hydroxymethylglutaryl-CoA lyase
VSASAPDVAVREVGMRDGLQMLPRVMPTEQKVRWLERTLAAGFEEIEIGSFVPPKYLPQFGDIEEVARHAKRHASLTAAALVPNLKGAERAIAAGVQKIICIVSATESFSQANLRRDKARSLEELRQILELREHTAPGLAVEVGISVAFGCPFEGRVSLADVCALAVLAMREGADQVSLADTAGLGDPALVARTFRAVLQEIPAASVGAHFHDTRSMGFANVLAALNAGVRAFDASLAGLGGCPNSPGATGNIATEDLIFMLEAMGFDTGIDLERLLENRAFLAQSLPGVRLYGRVGEVGVPKGFRNARTTRRRAAESAA